MSVEEEAVPLSGENRLAHKAMARSVATPTNKLPLSSVFVTPPASMERKRSSDLPPPAPGIQPPLFPTPEATPTSTRAVSAKLRLEEGENAVSGLFVGGYRLLTGQILDYLDPQDLYNCTLVCSRWYQLISTRHNLLSRIRAHTKDLHRNYENADKPFVSLVELNSNRKPLGDAKNRLLVRNGQGSTPSLPAKSTMSVPKRVMYKHRHCPQCSSPSKQLNLRRAECTNAKCRFDFCSSCLKCWHDGECERLRSPKRHSNEVVAGSKRSKKNLRRL